MKILFLTPRLPLPADTGAKIRTFNLLKQAAKHNEVSLLSFEFEKYAKAKEQFRTLGIRLHTVPAHESANPLHLYGKAPLSIRKYTNSLMHKTLLELIKEEYFDLIHFDHLHMAQYREYTSGIPSVLDEHNVESMILERCAKVEKNIIKKALYESQAKKMAVYEAPEAQKFSCCLTVSEDDKKNLSSMCDEKTRIEVITNGVDTDFFSLTARSYQLKDELSLVFTGSMDWLPNTDAVLYFCKDILPLIWQTNDKIKFYVVGKNPSQEILRMGNKDNRIIVTGVVDDVRPYVAQAKVFVVPLRIGGGTRLKILEAMSMEKAVVSTTIGAEGIDYVANRHLVLADEARDFAEKILVLLNDSSKSHALGTYGHQLVTNFYDWNSIGNQLQSVYRTLHNE